MSDESDSDLDLIDVIAIAVSKVIPTGGKRHEVARAALGAMKSMENKIPMSLLGRTQNFLYDMAVQYCDREGRSPKEIQKRGVGDEALTKSFNRWSCGESSCAACRARRLLVEFRAEAARSLRTSVMAAEANK